MADDTTNIQDEISLKLKDRINKLKFHKEHNPLYIKCNPLYIVNSEILFLENIIEHINKFNNE